ncbi:MAG: hypothetical protein AAF789_08150, partial [Bacteroidota bacterium]
VDPAGRYPGPGAGGGRGGLCGGLFLSGLAAEAGSGGGGAGDRAGGRAGYFSEHDNKGDRKYFTFGAGFRYQVFGVDFSYLAAQGQNNPLANTIRLSLLFNLNQQTE